LPERMHSKKVASIGAGVRRYQGQKQRWFLLKLISDQKNIHFDETQTPEFNEFKWVDYWYPLGEVIYFKRQVYGKVLHEFEGCLSYA